MLSSEVMKKGPPPSSGAMVGATVRQLRRDRGWTLATLSEKTSISVSGLSQLESGKTTRVRRENLTRLAAAFDVSAEVLDPQLWAARVAREASTLDQRKLVDAILSLSEDDAAEAKRVIAELASRRRRSRS
jgi:transcriptional regulator with XRE-family HTH domain